MKTYIDLHIHSTASDGTFSPTEIVNKALKLTEKDSPVVIALTDHDTVAGIDEFQKAAAKHKDRLTAISGLEISTDYHGVEIHVLGYNIDIHNKELLDRLAVCRESRDGRNEKIIQKLQEQGSPPVPVTPRSARLPAAAPRRLATPCSWAPRPEPTTPPRP